MRTRLIRSGHALVRRLILISFLLLPWPALAEEVAALPLSKIVLYSSGVGYFQHDGTVHNRAQLELRLHANQINDMLKRSGRTGLRRWEGLDRDLWLTRSGHQDTQQLRD